MAMDARRNRGRRGLAAVCLAAGLLSACAATRLTDLYRDPGYVGGPLESLLVVGVLDGPERRRLFEEAFVRELQRRRVAARGSLEALGAEAPASIEGLQPALARLGMAGGLLVRLLELREERAYTPPVYYRREITPGTNAYVYSPTPADLVVKEGYTVTYAHYRLESRLFRAGGEAPLWSVQSETVSPEAAERVAADLSRAVLDGLAGSGLLP